MPSERSTLKENSTGELIDWDVMGGLPTELELLVQELLGWPFCDVGVLEGPRWPSGCLENDSRMPPLTRPPTVSPYKDLRTVDAAAASWNCGERQDASRQYPLLLNGELSQKTHFDEAHRSVRLLAVAQPPVTLAP